MAVCRRPALSVAVAWHFVGPTIRVATGVPKEIREKTQAFATLPVFRCPNPGSICLEINFDDPYMLGPVFETNSLEAPVHVQIWPSRCKVGNGFGPSLTFAVFVTKSGKAGRTSAGHGYAVRELMCMETSR